MDFASCADIFIAGHYYGAGSPYLFTREDAKSPDFKIRTIADISCDIDGPVASTIRPSTIENPIYGYNPHTESEDIFNKEDVITVMAVDNLPCELPKDASEDFVNELITHIFPCLLSEDSDNIIDKATICKNGDLNAPYEYLRDYLNGY
jgi:alanine dehydrogenase